MEMSEGREAGRPINPHGAEYAQFAERYLRELQVVSAPGFEVRLASRTRGWRMFAAPQLVTVTVPGEFAVTFLGSADVLGELERACEPDVFADGAPRIDFREWASLMAGPVAEAAFEFSIGAFAEAAGEEAARAVVRAAERDRLALPGLPLPVASEARALAWWDDHVEPLDCVDVEALRSAFQGPRSWFLEACWLAEASMRAHRDLEPLSGRR